jgi:integrase
MGIKKSSKKPGTYEVSYSKRHPKTRKSVQRRRRGFKNMSEAKKDYARQILEVEDQIRRTILPSWEKLVYLFREGMIERGLMFKTTETYFLCLRAHTFEDWSGRLIDTITTVEVRELIKRRVGHRSPSHQKNLLKFIRGAFNFAVESGYIQRNPVPRMKFRIGEKIKKVLTSEQVKTLLNRACEYNTEWYPHWCMALYTGMRNGELYALTWDKVNLENRQLLIDTSWNSKDGFKETKSGDDRLIDIAPNLLSILKELKLQSLDPVFVLPRIDKWDRGEQARELRMFLLGLGLPSIRFHDLRATWATTLLSKGIPPIKVMMMGGWRDLKTMQFYVRKAGVDIKGVMESLDLHSPDKSIAPVINFTQN